MYGSWVRVPAGSLSKSKPPDNQGVFYFIFSTFLGDSQPNFAYMEVKKLAISIQPKITGKKVLLMAWINMNQTEMIHSPSGSFDPTNDTMINFIDRFQKRYVRIVVSTGISIPKEFWDSNRRIGRAPYQDCMKEAEAFTSYVNVLYQSMVSSGIEVDKILLKEKIQEHIIPQVKVNKRKKTSPTTDVKIPRYFGKKYKGIPTLLLDYVLWKVDEYEKRAYFETKISSSTLTTYRKFANRVKEYQFESKKIIDLMETTNEDALDFISYFTHKKKADGSQFYAFNTLSDIKKTIKLFIRKAKIEDNIPVPADLMGKRFTNSWEREEDPYLNFEQLDLLRNLTFTQEKQYLRKVRDMFLIGCNAGTSFIDLINLHHIYPTTPKGFQFRYTRVKTSKTISVPVKRKYVMDIYKEYGERFDFKISEQKFNQYLREVCRLAGLDEPAEKITRDPITGNKIEVKTKFIHLDKLTGKEVIVNDSLRLWQRISSKCMRKTFASNEVREYRTEFNVLREYTGHSDDKTLKTYIMLNDGEYYNLINTAKNKKWKGHGHLW